MVDGMITELWNGSSKMLRLSGICRLEELDVDEMEEVDVADIVVEESTLVLETEGMTPPGGSALTLSQYTEIGGTGVLPFLFVG